MLGMGQMPGLQGEAGSNYGFGTTPYGVNPKEAPNAMNSEQRQGESQQGDVEPGQFESLYEPEENAHAFSSEERLHGKMDLTQSPKKIEEIRSAPETQEALTAYANVVGAYAEGEESAIEKEQVPLEYQELVRKYFDQVQKDAAAAEKEKKDEPEKEEESEK
jgi:hypothetical protein